MKNRKKIIAKHTLCARGIFVPQKEPVEPKAQVLIVLKKPKVKQPELTY